MSVKKPGFYEKFIILTNGVYEETGFLGSECVNPEFAMVVVTIANLFSESAFSRTLHFFIWICFRTISFER
jgi:hypothetical protein